jgi:hypothetical protein
LVSGTQRGASSQLEGYSRSLINIVTQIFSDEKLRNLKYLPLGAIIILILATIPAAYAFTTKVNINPSNTTLLIGQSFTENVTITNVANLNNWQIVLSFNPFTLNCTGLTIPSDSIFAGKSYFFPPPRIDNTVGQIVAFCGLLGAPNANVSGSGRLAVITFTSRSVGVSALTFLNVMKRQIDGTYILDPSSSIIPFDAGSGIVEVIASGFTKNVFGVTKNAQTYYVAIRTNSTVTVSPYYNGSSRELAFSISGATGTKGACIVEIDKHLVNGTLITLLNNVALCTYSRTVSTLLENATHIFTYFNFTYNTSTKNVKIRLTVTGDLNGDQKVDIKDVALESAAFGTIPGYAKWNPVADVDHNFKIEIKDLALVSKSFGTWLPP